MKLQGIRLLRKIDSLAALWIATLVAIWGISLVLWFGSYTRNYNILTVLFLTFVDALIIVLPIIFMRGRSAGIFGVVIVWILSAFIEVNLLYYRFFHDLTPFPSFFMFDNFGGLLLKSTFSLVKWSDIILFLIPAAFTFVWAKKWRKNLSGKVFSSRQRIVLSLAAVALFGCQQLKLHIINPRFTVKLRTATPLNWLNMAKSNIFLYTYNGLVVYTVGAALDLFNSREIKTLTPEQEALVSEALDDRPTPSGEYAEKSNKNLFLIVVESFNSWPVGMKVGDESVTPVIDSLCQLDNSLWSADMISQIRDGGSSDGQMLYNTGLMPIDRNATVQFFAGNRFYSLAETLRGDGYKSAVEITNDIPGLWHHSVTTKSWGYDKLYDVDSLKLSPRNAEGLGRDGLIFQYALDVAATLPEPFLMEIITISMHTPYSEAGISYDKLRVDSLSKVQNDFLQVTHYFDKCLGDFLNRLKTDGLLDRSIIVIAADHDAPDAGERMPIFFMITGGGIRGGRIEGTMGQVDVYPTILDVMGRLDSAKWPGLGRSVASRRAFGALRPDGLFFGNPSANEKKRMENADKASNLIIRNNYFNRQ